MNKQELIAAIAKQTKNTKVDTEQFINAFVGVLSKTLKKGDHLRLVGFGSFKVHKRKATKGRNPRTGEIIKIASLKQAKFKPGKGLREYLN